MPDESKAGVWSRSAADIQEPPAHLIGILRHLGPGLIIAGSIVGSGELIATTQTGAEAGFALLWIILVGCIIKVFTQIEFGRFSIVTGETTMQGLNDLPGPALELPALSSKRQDRVRVNWYLVFWFGLTVIGIGQLGGVVGGVGQAMAIGAPITESGRAYNAATAELIREKVALAELRQTDAPTQDAEARVETLAAQADALKPASHDDRYWVIIIGLITAAILVRGKYGLIQTVSTILVATFTVVTVINLVALQTYGAWAIQPSEFMEGLKFRLPAISEELGRSPLATALMTFGIIGVGSAELLAYPYWCLEKGYAKFAGPHDRSDAWAERAQGWMRVLRWDAFCSMCIYTFATIAFYLLGAAILSRVGLHPEGTDMIATLATMYGPVFGDWATWVFIIGAFIVLYSTFFVASGGGARVLADAFRVFGLIGDDDDSLQRWNRILCGAYPILSVLVYLFYRQPVQLVLIGGAMQAIALPILASAALYFRYRRSDERIAPSKLWDAALWSSAAAFFVVGAYLTARIIYPEIDQIL